MRHLYAKRFETLGVAREAGVPIFCGTDAGGVVPHGLAAREVVRLGQVGSPDFAMGAATWRARPWLGHQNLEVGASADFIVCLDDPRKDLRAVTTPAFVVLRGRVYGPGDRLPADEHHEH